jgi:hypothetical protein
MRQSILLAVPVSVVLLCPVATGQAQDTAVQQAAIATPIPPLLDNWKTAAAGPEASLDDAIKIAEGCRPNLPDRDPFTRIVNMSCAERLAKGERVVWEDDMLMALVDINGSKLLIVPKAVKNYPIDLIEQMPYVSRAAAATCDALVVAADGKPQDDFASCRMYINPPCTLFVRQIHVHIEPVAGMTAPNEMFLRRAATHLRSLLAGSGCF